MKHKRRKKTLLWSQNEKYYIFYVALFLYGKQFSLTYNEKKSYENIYTRNSLNFFTFPLFTFLESETTLKLLIFFLPKQTHKDKGMSNH